MGEGAWDDLPARTESELTILLYHGVTDTPSAGIENYSGKHIAASDFAAQMETIGRHCTVLSIDDVVGLSSRGAPFPRRAVVVSFDDGFANNYAVAAPILEKWRIPAVFYVSSGLIDTGLMFWVDALEDCLNLTAETAIAVTLEGPRDFPIATREERITALDTIKDFCKRAPAAHRDRVLAELVRATGVEPRVEHAVNYRAMSWKQLRALAANPLFTVGGHSLYHDILSEMPLARMRQDVQLSLDLLAYHLERPTVHYSYPEGQPHHYNEQIIEVLKQHGVVCCPSAIHGLNPPGSDLFHLRRVMVGFRGCPFPFTRLAHH